MWISLEKRLVELWFHENLLVRFHWKTVDVNGRHNLSNMIHSSAWKWAIPVVDDHSIIKKWMESAQVWSRAVERQGLLWTHQGDATAGWSGWQVLGSWGSLVTGNILCSHRSDMFRISGILRGFGCPIKTWSHNILIMFGACFPGLVWLRMPRSWWFPRRRRTRLWRSPSLATTSHFTRSVGNLPPPIGQSKSQRFTILGWEIY